jgi:hypothetical protein
VTPAQWARVLRVGSDAAERETIDGSLQPGHLPGPLAVALAAMAREAQRISEGEL